MALTRRNLQSAYDYVAKIAGRATADKALGHASVSAVPDDQIDMAVAALMCATGRPFAMASARRPGTIHERLAAIARRVYAR